MDVIEYNKKTRTTDWSMTELHSHEFYELYFLTNGSRNIVFEKSKVELLPNSLVIIPPFTPHLTEGGKHERINIFFSSNFIDEIFSSATMINNAGAYFIDQNNWTIISKLLNSAIEIDNGSDSGAYLNKIKTYFLNTILWYIVNGNLKPIKLSHFFNKQKHEQQITKIVQYINDNFSENLTIQSICEQFFFTKSNLYKYFEQFMSIPIGEYILFTRLNHAKKLLQTTKLPIDKIAYECGFSSQNYFALIFKRKFGVTPSYFRKLRY